MIYTRKKILSSNDYLYLEISSKYDLKVQRIDQGIDNENQGGKGHRTLRENPRNLHPRETFRENSESPRIVS